MEKCNWRCLISLDVPGGQLASGLLVQAVGVPFSSDRLWPEIFIPPFIASLAALAMFFWTYESPQHIIESSGDLEKARKALAFYHAKDPNSPEIEEELKVCVDGVAKKSAKKDAEKAIPAEKTKSISDNGFNIIFNPIKTNDSRSRVIRTGAWVGVMVKIAYVFTGARCLRAFSTYVLHDMGFWSLEAAKLGSLLIGVLRLPFTFVPVLIVERVGRRPLILGSLAASVVMILLLMASIFIGESWKVGTLVALTGLLMVNACGLGSISRFYCAEVVPRSILVNSVSWLTAIEAAAKIGVEFSFYPVAHVSGAFSFLIFLAPTALFLVISWYLCPETKGKQVNEVLNKMAKIRHCKITFKPGHDAALA